MAPRRDRIDAARLAYLSEVLHLIEQARAEGRPVILASASHWRHIRRIADHLALSDPVIATRGRSNLKGAAKLAAIRARIGADTPFRSEEHTSELQSLMRNSYAVFCLKKKKNESHSRIQ